MLSVTRHTRKSLTINQSLTLTVPLRVGEPLGMVPIG